MAKNRYRIYVFISSGDTANARKISGILSFAGERKNWDIYVFTEPFQSESSLRHIAGRKPDGVIVSRFETIRQLRKIHAADLPCILVDDFIPSTPTPRSGMPDCQLLCDSAKIGRTAAQIFRQRGVTRFAYAGIADGGDESDVRHSKIRLEAFRKTLGRKATVSVYEEPIRYALQRLADSPALDEWIRTIPKPCGIFAYSDVLALSIVETCRRNGIKIPSEAMILGVDNDCSICENSDPTLSSIEPDFVGAGKLAATMLHRLLGKRQPKTTVRKFYPAPKTVLRMSTQKVSGVPHRIALARETIRTQACAGLQAKEVAEKLGVTLRSIEIAFKKATGRSLRDEILETRLTEVKRRLKETNDPIEMIGDTCGFKTANALKVIFKRRFGISMRDWRKTNA